MSRGGYEFVPDMRIAPESAIPPWSKPPGHPKVPDMQPAPWAEARKGKGDSPEPMGHHARHFIDCVKSRQRPIADVEDGHQVAVSCHLANLSMKLGRESALGRRPRRLLATGRPRRMLVRPYRKPWDDVLRSFNL